MFTHWVNACMGLQVLQGQVAHNDRIGVKIYYKRARKFLKGRMVHSSRNWFHKHRPSLNLGVGRMIPEPPVFKEQLSGDSSDVIDILCRAAVPDAIRDGTSIKRTKPIRDKCITPILSKIPGSQPPKT